MFFARASNVLVLEGYILTGTGNAQADQNIHQKSVFSSNLTKFRIRVEEPFFHVIN